PPASPRRPRCAYRSRTRKTSSTLLRKNRARPTARGSEGMYRPTSIELIVCRDTPIAVASSPWDTPRAARHSPTRLPVTSSSTLTPPVLSSVLDRLQRDGYRRLCQVCLTG